MEILLLRMMNGYRKTDFFDYLIMFRELREWLHLLLLYGFLYICAFVVTSGFIINAKQDNLQVQNYAPPSEPVQQIITTEGVLETVFHFLKEMNSENL